MKAVALTLIVAAMGTWANVARANHFVGACAFELNAVEAAIQGAAFQGQNATTDQSNLLAKLEAANAKVADGKFSDAVDKLDEISDRATTLAGAPKPKLADATAINTAVTAAIACVGRL
jgi:long-subunit fatty acid transport protein